MWKNTETRDRAVGMVRVYFTIVPGKRGYWRWPLGYPLLAGLPSCPMGVLAASLGVRLPGAMPSFGTERALTAVEAEFGIDPKDQSRIMHAFDGYAVLPQYERCDRVMREIEVEPQTASEAAERMVAASKRLRPDQG